MTRNETKIKSTLLNPYTIPSGFYDGLHTKTTQFILPSVSIDMRNRQNCKFFINAFLDDRGRNHNYTRPIFVLMGVNSFEDKEWQKVYNQIVLSKDYIDDYDCGVQDIMSDNKRTSTVNLVMLVFSVPDEYAQDYYSFKRGRYSKFSTKYKEKFPRYSDGNKSGSESYLWRVINKSASLKRELEEEFGMDYGEMDLPTIIDGVTYPPAEEIWDVPRKEREYYRYVKDVPVT